MMMQQHGFQRARMNSSSSVCFVCSETYGKGKMKRLQVEMKVVVCNRRSGNGSNMDRGKGMWTCRDRGYVHHCQDIFRRTIAWKNRGEEVACKSSSSSSSVKPSTKVGPSTTPETLQGAGRGKKPKQISRRVAIMVEPSPFSHVSGMRNRFLKLIEGLCAAGDEVLVFTPDDAAPAEWHGAKVVAVTGFLMPFYPSETLRLSPGIDAGLWSSIEAFKPDVLHCSSPGFMVFAAIAIANFYELPLVVSYHTHVPEYIPKYAWEGIVEPGQKLMWTAIRACSEAAALTLVTSSIMQEELRKNGCKRVMVWQKGVDTDAFNPRFASDDTRNKLLGKYAESAEARGPIIGYVGRLGSEKNTTALRDILSKLPESLIKKATLVLIGDGPARADLEEHFSGTRTIFTGMLHGEELSKAYASLDVFVMPSETETLGFVVLEAMASGVPIVAVAAGGLLDIVDESKGGGCFYQPGDYGKASELVAEILLDKIKRKKMGEAARLEVMAWGWQAATDKLRVETYTRAIRRTRVKRIAKRLLRRLTPLYLLARMKDIVLWVTQKLQLKQAWLTIFNGVKGRSPTMVAAGLAIFLSISAILALKKAINLR